MTTLPVNLNLSNKVLTTVTSHNGLSKGMNFNQKNGPPQGVSASHWLALFTKISASALSESISIFKVRLRNGILQYYYLLLEQSISLNSRTATGTLDTNFKLKVQAVLFCQICTSLLIVDFLADAADQSQQTKKERLPK